MKSQRDFIELAGEINTHMPHYVVDKLARALDRHLGRGLSNARILIIGIAYKKNIDDIRESPALKLIELIEERGASVDFYDPHVPVIPEVARAWATRGQIQHQMDAAGP